MNRKALAGVFLIIGITFIIVIIIQQRRQHSMLQYVQEDEIISSLKDGDVICRLGDRLWSSFFKELSPNEKRFSHLGIVRIRGGVVSVINAEGLAVEGKDCVNEAPLKDFLKTAQSIGIYRLKNIEGSEISDAAVEYKGYPFDWQFDMNEADKLYCSELLYVILKRIDADITLDSIWLKEIGKYIIPLDICSQKEYFVEVGYWRNNRVVQ